VSPIFSLFLAHDLVVSAFYPNNNVLKNGLMIGAPELLLEVKGNGYRLVKELRVAKEVLE